MGLAQARPNKTVQHRSALLAQAHPTRATMFHTPLVMTKEIILGECKAFVGRVNTSTIRGNKRAGLRIHNDESMKGQVDAQ